VTEPPKRVPDPGFAGDTGEADPVVLSALAAFESGQAGAAVVDGVLAGSRVLVPLLAVLTDPDPGEPAPAAPAGGAGAGGAAGLRSDKTADMAIVTVTGRDGRRGLPVFTSVAALQAWNAAARPVPVEAARAARAALDDGAAALLVDPSPRPRFVVTGERLALLAAGWPA